MIDHYIEVDGVTVSFTSEPEKTAIIEVPSEKRKITLSKEQWNNLRSILSLIEFKAKYSVFGF